ncbi:MAG: DUF1858 domain-containing protein [Clostridiales bacterium]|nr:DUF1858 domain-containing protein [Clostridiales bacterium]MBQ2816678.1 DUF1858 domain-containing protein [Clostridia bacterium]MBQ4637598.1 DUF1858 domain-containing protein [Clostridia bacterium]
MAKISKEMTVGQVLALDRSSARVFLEYGMTCLGCPHATAESIAQAGAVHGVDVDALIEALNKHFGE